jgi:hypothetical protein
LKTDRKEITIQEIEYWKSSKLLTEMYCDYLLTLYTKGDRNFSKKRRGPLFLLLLSLFPITYLFIYFTELSFHLQMLIKSFFLLIIIETVFIFRKDVILLHLLMIFAANFFYFLYEYFF